ncbi:hypothetical protein OIN60_05380 [Paenibacillus sp. P96]|uniref:DUF697 domain-containing protein n=1 Tax=Paenibacillus zeirhizosphaerae TaxID=2987519 RepID=A0ABT9FN92_9BACL|nr:hypothetical protein [Paenibacillus sp. P96]MDP4096202.1 hypothetical protein [Paenibacillus sp. P96]
MIPHTIEELDHIRRECRSMVTKRAIASGGTTLIPLPGADIFADVGILMQLLPDINAKFGLSERELSGMDTETKSMVYGLITSVGSKLIGRVITREIILHLLQKIGLRIATKQAARLVPLLGQGLAAALGFTAMRMIGNRHIDECYEVARRLMEQRSAADNAAEWTVSQTLPEPLPAGRVIPLLPVGAERRTKLTPGQEGPISSAAPRTI